MPFSVIRPSIIGKVAAQSLKLASNFSIRGVTSRGIFTLLDDQTIVFLSRESFKGPLNVLFSWNSPALEQIDLQSKGQIIQNRFVFSSLELQIDCQETELWSATDIWNPTNLPPLNYDNKNLVDFLRFFQSHAENELVHSVLSSIDPAVPPHPDMDERYLQEIEQIDFALREGDIDAIQRSAYFFAGRGRGLTPSGDDFLLGVVYGLYCLQEKLTEEQINLAGPLVNLVKQRSTLISANLIEYAAAGEVDERLGAAFHAMVAPSERTQNALEALLSWGSSSGMDAAAGMILLLNAMR